MNFIKMFHQNCPQQALNQFTVMRILGLVDSMWRYTLCRENWLTSTAFFDRCKIFYDKFSRDFVKVMDFVVLTPLSHETLFEK